MSFLRSFSSPENKIPRLDLFRYRRDVWRLVISMVLQDKYGTIDGLTFAAYDKPIVDRIKSDFRIVFHRFGGRKQY